ncbi:MAG: hypothetical protein BWZ02_03109 [Lentisphaerae bacterium ADurb.BinA184]|nr:MAG: hypothetical protein BWZ02_03109 [Lentisphaerae bacterium ADurb.BinA184]
MKTHRPSTSDWAPLAREAATAPEIPSGRAFNPAWIDFARGIRVGNLEPHERITQILKYDLEQRYGTRFITDRWGRGVYWQWICWLPRANREAKPLSNAVNFGCAKLFITCDAEPAVFKSGLQIERGYAEGPAPYPGCRLAPDWDWHRLIAQCEGGTRLDAELRRLIGREGFVAEAGDLDGDAVFTKGSFTSARQIREALAGCPRRQWAGFQLYYPMPVAEVRSCTGLELVKAVCAVFREVVPAMNECMQVPLRAGPASPKGMSPREGGGGRRDSRPGRRPSA